MYKLFIICLALLITPILFAQKMLVRIPISSVTTTENDTISIAMIRLSAFTNLIIKEQTTVVVHHVFVTNKDEDTTIIAKGKCQLIKGQYYYFGVRHKANEIPQQGDILSMLVEKPVCYEGLLYDMSRNSITFTTVDGKEFYNWETPFLLTKEEEETPYFKHIVSDIQYTGKEMVKQMPEANKLVVGGLFDQQKLFDVMQKVTVAQVQEFFKYMKARPRKYTGQQWKVSEVFATWVDAGAPQVIVAKN
jgi:hypothetical protein